MESNSTGDEVASAWASNLHIALLCTGAVYVVHKMKRAKTEAAGLRELLWGIKFQPLSTSQRSLLAVLGPVGLLALVGHAWMLLGTGAAIIVIGLVVIVLRTAGIFQLLGKQLRSLRPAPRAPLQLGRPGAPLPVWVLTGFLGSGKTTLVNRLVRARAGSPQRLLVLENEAGETALDAELILEAAGSRESVLQLGDGCACCRVRGDLCDLLRDEVLGKRVPEGDIGGMVIECSGLADPRAVVQTFLLDEELRSCLELREVVAVVDALHVGRYLRSKVDKDKPSDASLSRLVEEQLAFASLVVLNKLDCVPGPRDAERLKAAIRRVNETADVLGCSFCDIDVDRLLGGGGFQQLPSVWSPDRAVLEVERVHVSVGKDAPRGDAKLSEEPMLGIRCVSLRVEGELDLDMFNRWVLTTLSDMEVLRAKGVLAARGHDRKLAFQAVHAVFHGTPLLTARWQPCELRFSQVVVIGCDLRVDLLEFGLRRCRAS